MFDWQILCNPDSDRPHCHGASIARSDGGDLVVVWYGYPEDETRDAVLYLACKRPGAKAFGPAKRILSQMNRSLGNPVPFFDDSGRLHLIFAALTGHYWDSAVLLACYSDDSGHTWSTPESLRQPAGMMVRHQPIRRGNGFLLLPAYDEKTNETVLLTSDRDAANWMAVDRFEGSTAIQGSLARQDDDNLCMMLRPCGDLRTCMRSISGDDGRSWSGPIRTPLPSALSGVAAFQANEFLCTVYNHTTEHQRFPLSLSYSTDRGTSWTGPVHIDTTEHELSYPSFVVDDRNIVHGVYTFGRSRIRYVSFDQQWWLNHDGLRADR